MKLSRLLVLVPALVLPCLPAAATTYKMVSDQALTDQASAVAEVRVTSAEPAPVPGRPATDYLVDVERLVKGDLPGSTIVVRVPGGLGADGVGLRIFGAPAFREGETALLFLRPAADGTYRILHLMLGAFHRATVDGRQVAMRDLSDAFEVGPAGIEARRDMARDFDRFSDWVADRGRGLSRDRDYVLDASTQELDKATASFTLMKPDDGVPIRWFTFDSGGSVSWKVHASGQPGLGVDASIQAFKAGLDAWVSDAGSNVRYTYNGTTNANGGLDHDDGVNAILFDDPRGNEADGTFSCSEGGVIAVGGPYFFNSTRNFDGKAWHEAAEADIVTNDGTDCFFQNNLSVAQEVFAHELGHTLGLGHSSVRDALMWPNAHDDSRGARLSADDRAGIASIYPVGSGGGNVPAAPGGLTAQATSSTQVSLSWTDNSTDETGFRVESKVRGGVFKEVLSLPAGTTSAVSAMVSGLKASTEYIFRVRASGASGFSAYSATASVTTPGASTAPPPPPPGLLDDAPVCGDGETLCLLGSRFKVRVAWRNNVQGGTTGVGHAVGRTDQSGTFWFFGPQSVELTVKALDGRAVNGKLWVFAGSLTDLEYWLEVTDSVTGTVRLYHNKQGDTRGFADTGFPATGASDAREVAALSPKQAPVTQTATAAAGACVADARTLCLLDRYEVEVTWKTTDGQTGAGTAIPDSANSGFFWFFGPQNLELVVKLLDGTSINGKLWVFYGSLSDVEYTVKVTDTQTGRVKTWRNQQGSLSGAADTSAL
ncbi:MAG: matrixin family metalloprotease [Acidobacteriota bacterium]